MARRAAFAEESPRSNQFSCPGNSTNDSSGSLAAPLQNPVGAEIPTFTEYPKSRALESSKLIKSVANKSVAEIVCDPLPSAVKRISQSSRSGTATENLGYPSEEVVSI